MDFLSGNFLFLCFNEATEVFEEAHKDLEGRLNDEVDCEHDGVEF
jgi:hypothetical protein